MPWDRIPGSVKLLARSLVTAVALYWVLRIVPFAHIIEVLRGAKPGYLAAGFALPLLARIPAAVRMKVLSDAQGLGLSRSAILTTLFATSFYGLLMPGSIAGGATTWAKYVQHGARSGPALAAIVVNRMTEIVTVLACGLSYWTIDRFLGGAAAALFLAAAFAVLGVSYAFVLGRSHYVSKVTAIAGRGGRFDDSWLFRKLSAFAGHVGRMRELQRRSIALVLTACITQDLLSAASLWFHAHALGLDLGFLTVAWMRALIYGLSLLPITVAGLGVRESALVVVTSPYGVAPAAALAWSTLIFAGTLLAAVGGGLVEARALWRRRS